MQARSPTAIINFSVTQCYEQVCGLCGDYDGDMSNDFLMRAGDVAADPNMFGNDWKVRKHLKELHVDRI